MMRPQYSYIILSTLAQVFATARLIGIPSTPFEASSTEEAFLTSSVKSIIVDTGFADARDENGETLIPPSLREFASTFASDLQSTFEVHINVTLGEELLPDSIFFTLDQETSYVDAAGKSTSEGYTLLITASGITVLGASPLGTWWGSRAILQQAMLGKGSLPLGITKDAPNWGIRGMMLDAARHYYPPQFLVEMCAYMSFFKQNTFHLHLSDNLYNNAEIYSTEQSLDLYARFRLWSDSEAVAGLNKYKNESYTREQFEDIQSSCAARGVTILPEIEAPGHALVIVQWKPELGLSDDLSLLNVSHPDTIPTMKTIWSDFLPWFHSKTVHIGADEYTAEVSEYNRFVNEIAVYISEESSKSVRIWGTFPPKPEYENIYNNVSVQHWEFFEDNPYFDYMLKNYSVLNSDDTYYVVNKWSGSYPQEVDITKTFHGDPSSNGYWYPNIFDTKNATNNPNATNPLIIGGVAPLWNDYGANATVYSEAYYAWKEGIPALADKQWGGDLAETEFRSVFSTLQPLVPGQNLDRNIPSKGPTIFNYTSSSLQSVDNLTTVQDRSGNDYDGITTCKLADNGTSLAITPSCSLKTPLSSKGRDYTFKFTLRVDELIDSSNATVISGTDSSLMLTPNVTLFASGNYYRLNSSIPLHTWVDFSIVGSGNRTFAIVTPLSTGSDYSAIDESSREEFLAILGINGDHFVWAPIAVEAPLVELGGENSGWSGQLAAMSLRSDA